MTAASKPKLGLAQYKALQELSMANRAAVLADEQRPRLAIVKSKHERLEQYADAIVGAFKFLIARSQAPLERRIAELERRLAEREARDG